MTTASTNTSAIRTEGKRLYSDAERARRDATRWTLVQGVLAPLQFAVFLVSLGLVLAVAVAPPHAPHRLLGYAVVALSMAQAASGVLRGSKGGPTDAHPAGDHYDMTPRRILFERLHKSVGYLTLPLAALATFSGLWAANGPVWMFLAVGAIWAGFALVFAGLQAGGFAFDTYQAIWGPDPELPGNRRRPIGWGIRRIEHRKR